jgi:hypothetical protein
VTLKQHEVIFIFFYFYFFTVHVSISLLLKPTHATLESLIKTHYSKTLKCLCPSLPYMFLSPDWPSSGAHCSSLSYLLAICSVLHNLTLECGLLSAYVAICTSPLHAWKFTPGVQWRGTNSHVGRKQATGPGKVVQKILHMASRWLSEEHWVPDDGQSGDRNM